MTHYFDPQLPMFGGGDGGGRDEPYSDIEARFWIFHRDNPRVYVELLRLAKVAQAFGRKRVGVRMLWEVMRWAITIETHDPLSEYKLNDHYMAHYARMLMRENPELDGMFELRQLRS
jgi:hypothetical protein